MKNHLLSGTLFLFSLILIVQPLSAQDSTAIRKIKSFSQHFVAFSKSYPQEKVYLHFDNTSYYSGETIWFKAYAVRADRNSLTNLSKILYVELLNAEGYVVDTRKLKLENGACHGDFKLNASGYGGFYEIRAYTRYMLNFGDTNYFSRIFPVYDAPKNPGIYATHITDRPNSQRIPTIRPDESHKEPLNLNFFPEGGNLIQDIPSRVAFKATEKNGNAALVTGSVYNDKNEKVVDINAEYYGMGSFEFTPTAGKYYARVSCNGHNYKYDLPVPLNNGYSMTIDNSTDENMDILIRKNANTVSEPLGLSVSCRGVLYVFEEIGSFTENAIAFKCLKKLLPSGVSQITLYNASGDILCERLAFVNHQSQMKINVTQDKTEYQPYEKVKMDFQLNDARNNPVETTFSLSVCDGSTSAGNPYSTNILTDLLLSSEIKGYIENPGLYFQANDNSHRQALDLLMLTQGWTCYSWKLMAGKMPFDIKQPVEKELVLDGNIASVLLKKKLKNVDVSMILLSDSTSQQGKCKTDSAGNFNFAVMDFKGDAKLILQTKVKNKRKDSRIMLNRQFSPDPQSYTDALNTTQYFKTEKDSLSNEHSDTTDMYSLENQKNLSMSEREHLLGNVTVKEKRLPMKVSMKYDVIKEMDKMEDTGEWEPSDVYGFLNKTNKYVNSIPQPNGSVKLTYKGKKVIFIVRDSKSFATLVGDNSSNSGSGSSDNTGGTSRGFKARMPLIDEIESISIVEDIGTMSRLYGGILADPTNTVIAVITPKKDYRPVPNGVRSTTFAGYSYSREFFSPEYSRYRLPNDKDYRRTLYWNPDVKTDKDGHAGIMFNNNGSCKSMNISVETVTENGVIGTYNK
jgi:hypothetical protein